MTWPAHLPDAPAAAARLGCATTFPLDGPVLLGEGPETGLSVWVATGYETWISIGSITRHNPPDDRTVVVCRDDDKPQSDKDKSFSKKFTEWCSKCQLVVVATPWAIRRHDKSDFNDTIKEGGIEAVQARIDVTLLPDWTPPTRHSIAEARSILKSGISGFIETAIAHDEKRTAATLTAKADLTTAADFPEAEIARIEALASWRAACTEARRLAKVRPVTDESQAAAEAATEAAKVARELYSDAIEAASESRSDVDAIKRRIAQEANAVGMAKAGTPPVSAIRIDVGGGKSTAARFAGGEVASRSRLRCLRYSWRCLHGPIVIAT
jgi:hypothetical protein